MDEEMFDFGEPEFFEPEAIGVPGNRRFRLIARKGERTASLWLEREQLSELAGLLQQLLVQLRGEDVLRSTDTNAGQMPTPRNDFPTTSDIEFQVGSLALGYDEEHEAIVLFIAPLEIIEQEGEAYIGGEMEPRFRVLMNFELAERFIRDTESWITAGRPRCPLCRQPLNSPDEPHGCIKQNGHRQIASS
jgi:uncharacterized repeat protein (TIGR03847 family)